MFGASPVPFVFYSSTRNLFWLFVSQKHPTAKGQTWTVMCLLHLEQTDDPGDKQLQIFMAERTLSLGFHLLSVLCSQRSPQQVYILTQHCKAVGDFNVSSRSFWPISSDSLHLLLSSLQFVTPAMCDQKTLLISISPSSLLPQLTSSELSSFFRKQNGW